MRLTYIALICLCLLTAPAKAHRLDEYLQATIISLEPGHVSLTLRLVPGVTVAPAIIASIDRNADGIVSPEEQRVYAQRVLSDLYLKEDGNLLALRVVDTSFPPIPQMQAGAGEIRLTMAADLPAANGTHQLAFENKHQPAISVYLVNALVPQDTRLRIESQDRNQNQSFYRVSFSESTSAGAPKHSFSGFAGAFHLGMRHIAEGTDHLLFLFTLLLPAPLLAYGGRWTRSTPVRKSLLNILSIITAFTFGHSLTLALATFGLVQLPSRPIEVLIAVSILISTIHAFRPIFPGKEAAIAGFFGLIHGLAFASALNELGVNGWYRFISLFGFNLGIETMQIIVVLVILPSLLLLSRTPWYSPFRITGASLGAFASIAWIMERLSGKPNPYTSLIEQVAQRGGLIAFALLVTSLLKWSWHRRAEGLVTQRSQ